MSIDSSRDSIAAHLYGDGGNVDDLGGDAEFEELGWSSREWWVWFHARAMEQASAQFQLGLMYFNGQGVQQDDSKAVEWHTKAAEQGYADAQYNLGVMYANGRGVPQDFDKAVEWYTKAAGQGDAYAQERLVSLRKSMTAPQ